MWLGAAPLLSPLLSRVAFAQSGDVAPDQAPPTEAQRAEAVAAKAASATAELTVELARQAGEMAALRADFERRLREEQDKREAAIAAERERADAALKETRASMAWIQGLSLGGFAQTDLSVRQSSSDQLNNSTGEPLNQNRFVLRRARLRTEIDRGLVTGALELDGNTVNGPQMRVLNAEGTLRIPPVGTGPSLLGLTVGLFKIPFGWEVIQSDRDRLFLERSIAAQELFPGEYDLGARLAGGWRYIRYALAVQNGEPIGEKTFPVRDPNNAKDVTGRVGVETPFSPLVDFAAAFPGSRARDFTREQPPPRQASFGTIAMTTTAWTRARLSLSQRNRPRRRRISIDMPWAPICGWLCASPVWAPRQPTVKSHGPRTWAVVPA